MPSKELTAFAIAAHPDDIELTMAGALLLLKDVGWDIHYMTLANGSCGSMTLDADEIIAIRRRETIAACESLGATYHGSLVDDISIFYDKETLAQVSAIVRDVAHDIILTHALDDYMEDHMNTARLAVSAAFTRGMRNFNTNPQRPPVFNDVTLYHAMPHGLKDGLNRIAEPDIFVDIGSVLERKKAALGCHRSQKEWLDQSQGMDSYIQAMVDLNRQVGTMSGAFEYAEGYRRHNHLGLCSETADPLTEVLKGKTTAGR